MRKKPFAIGVVGLAMAGTAMIAPASARAGVVDVSCSGTASATFSPGLTNTPQDTSFTQADRDTLCISAKDPSVTSGGDSAAYSIASASCKVFTIGNYETTVTWSNGRQSVILFDNGYSTIGSNFEILTFGTVESGEFAGDTVQQTNTYPGLDPLACASPQGLTSLTGVTSLILTSA